MTDELKTPTFYNSTNLPPKNKCVIKTLSKVQDGPLSSRSPQDVARVHGLMHDEHALKPNPVKFYADLTSMGDYESTLNAMRDMSEKFKSLDLSVRSKFNHDINKFAAYCTSKDFDVKEVMSPAQYAAYEKELAQQKAVKDYEKYTKSQAYKDELAESEARRAYEQYKYEEWKKTYMNVTK